MDRECGDIGYRRIKYDSLRRKSYFINPRHDLKDFRGQWGQERAQALCHEAIRLSYINVGRNGLSGTPTDPMLGDATYMAFSEILRENNIPFEFNHAEAVLMIKETGSRVLFQAVEQFERLRGTNLAWFGVDELTYHDRRLVAAIRGTLTR